MRSKTQSYLPKKSLELKSQDVYNSAVVNQGGMCEIQLFQPRDNIDTTLLHSRAV